MKYLRLFFSSTFVLILILVISFVVRLYKIDSPVADWHSWRQADTAAVSRNFYKEGYNPLIPRYDDISGVAEDPIANPNRYRFVEFPIYNSLIFLGYLIHGGVDERIARVVSILFSLGSIVFIYLIVKKHINTQTALLSALLFGILPYSIYYSRVILPEPSLVFFSLGMFYFVEKWVTKNVLSTFILSVIFTSCAFLTKPSALMYLLPLGYVCFLKEGKWWPIPRKYILFLILSLLPLIAWRIWMMRFPEGIPASSWLFNGDGIRYKLIFWKWILSDRLGREILTVPGVILFFIGVFIRPRSSGEKILLLLAGSSLLYLLTIATGNVRHDYYQILIVPVLVIFVARGFFLLVEGHKNFIPRVFSLPLAILFLVLIIYLARVEIDPLYKINNPNIVEAGKFADKILPKKTLVIAPYNGDTAFLYQTNRAGLAFLPLPTEETINQFKTDYYISVNYDAKTKWIMRKYTVLEANPKFVIVDLTKQNPSFDKVHDLEPS